MVMVVETASWAASAPARASHSGGGKGCQPTAIGAAGDLSSTGGEAGVGGRGVSVALGGAVGAGRVAMGKGEDVEVGVSGRGVAVGIAVASDEVVGLENEAVRSPHAFIRTVTSKAIIGEVFITTALNHFTIKPHRQGRDRYSEILEA
jgi:hypothetical protein